MLPISKNLKEVNQWIAQYHPKCKQNEIPVPKFTIQTATRKFGYGAQQVESSILNLKSVATDAAYLKALLNFGYEHSHITYGTFVPTGIHLTAGTEVYKALLKGQNAYLNSILVLPVESISQDPIWQDIEIEGRLTTLGDYIIAHDGIEAIERTNKTETEGKRFLIYKNNTKD
eukprot:15282059-Ditylum_brightwellii.AAC.1